MDLHKPKPWRGVREFLKEYVIIVVGVLTALAAEQGVEWLHWRAKVEDGRTALRAELSAAAHNAQERVILRDCLEARTNYLRDQLRSAHGVWAAKPWSILENSPDGLAKGEGYSSTIRNWSTEVWRGLVADGTAVHFPRDEMLSYSRIYHFVEILEGENQREWQGLSRASLLGQQIQLSDQAIYETALGLEDAKRENRLMALGSSQVLRGLQSAGMMPSEAVSRERLAALRKRAARCVSAATQ